MLEPDRPNRPADRQPLIDSEPIEGPISRLREDLALYFRLAGADIRAQMQYKSSFVMLTLGSFVSIFLEFVTIVILFQRFPSIAGWSVGEVAFLYGIASLAFGLAEMLAGGFDHFPSLILRGDFDRLLVRPADTLVQLFCQEFLLRRLGRIGQGAVVFGLALALLTEQGQPVAWTVSRLAYLPVALASGAAIYVAVFVIGATLSFWTVQSNELVNIFTHGGTEMVQYPMEVYQGWFGRLFVFVVPLAFVSYFPSLYLLGRPDGLGLPPFFAFLSPAVAVIFLVVARGIWRFGVNHYQSTGS